MLIVRTRRAVLPDGVRPAAIHIRGGVIARVAAWDDVPAGARLDDVGELAVLPGIVDTHVHLNEPGRTEWEGFATATRAAAVGGVTTLVDMPLNSIPRDDHARGVRGEARGGARPVRGRRRVLGRRRAGQRGASSPGWSPTACAASSASSSTRGVAEFGWVGEARAGARRCRSSPGSACRCSSTPRSRARSTPRRAQLAHADPRAYATYLASRPPAAEEQAIALVTAAVPRRPARARTSSITRRRARCRCCARRAPRGCRSPPRPARTTCTSPPRTIPDGATPFKCAPPIREAANREALWQALAEGVLDLVASRSLAVHARRSRRSRSATSWPRGAASSGSSSRCRSCGPRRRARGHTLVDIVRWMCAGPARLAGLTGTKGAIAAGADADLVVFDDRRAARR